MSVVSVHEVAKGGERKGLGDWLGREREGEKEERNREGERDRCLGRITRG